MKPVTTHQRGLTADHFKSQHQYHAGKSSLLKKQFHHAERRDTKLDIATIDYDFEIAMDEVYASWTDEVRLIS